MMQPIGVNLIPVHRLVDRNSNSHDYTLDLNEANVLAQRGSHNYDGVVFQLLANPRSGAMPLYRFVCADGRHFLDGQNPSPVDPTARCESTLGFVMGPLAPGLAPLFCGSIRTTVCFSTRPIRRAKRRPRWGKPRKGRWPSWRPRDETGF